MTFDPSRLDDIPRAELIALGHQYGIERPERMTRVELKDELIRVSITDEAQAVEALGHRPRLVEGSAHNIKITHREDLVLAEAVLRKAAR